MVQIRRHPQSGSIAARVLQRSCGEAQHLTCLFVGCSSAARELCHMSITVRLRRGVLRILCDLYKERLVRIKLYLTPYSITNLGRIEQLLQPRRRCPMLAFSSCCWAVSSARAALPVCGPSLLPCARRFYLRTALDNSEQFQAHDVIKQHLRVSSSLTLSTASTSAPQSISICTISAWPSRDAIISAVRPS
jgi:hypothetical protein